MNFWLFPTLFMAFGFFGCGVYLARRVDEGINFDVLVILGALAALPGIAFSLYYLKLFDEPIWLYQFRSFPCSELAASGSGLLAGLLHGRFSSKPGFRRIAGRWFFPGVLLIGLWIPYAKPIVRPPQWNRFENRWSEGICLQTSESSCGPACASTLLSHVGQHATEKEIAQESFTSRSGTEVWYLARTLRHRGMSVRLSRQHDWVDPWPIPAMAGVRLPEAANAGHFITILGRSEDKYVIGDPLEGKLILSQTEARAKYRFTGFFLRIE